MADDTTIYERTANDLRRYFQAIDLVFFGGQLGQDGVRIRWKKFRPRQNEFLFAQYHSDQQLIEVNVRLKEHDVPDYVLLHTIHHECLHHVISIDHDTAFNEAELRFPWHWQSEKWSDNFVLMMGKPVTLKLC